LILKAWSFAWAFAGDTPKAAETHLAAAAQHVLGKAQHVNGAMRRVLCTLADLETTNSLKKLDSDNAFLPTQAGV
jgi:hypothetical protein